MKRPTEAETAVCGKCYGKKLCPLGCYGGQPHKCGGCNGTGKIRNEVMAAEAATDIQNHLDRPVSVGTPELLATPALTGDQAPPSPRGDSAATGGGPVALKDWRPRERGAPCGQCGRSSCACPDFDAMGDLVEAHPIGARAPTEPRAASGAHDDMELAAIRAAIAKWRDVGNRTEAGVTWQQVQHLLGRYDSLLEARAAAAVPEPDRPPVTDEQSSCGGCGEHSAPWFSWRRPDPGCWWVWDADDQTWLFLCRYDRTESP